MVSENVGSITLCIDQLKKGNSEPAQLLWDRYFRRLVGLARARLRAKRQTNLVEDEEDVALSAFDSFCRGAAAGRFSKLTDRDDLWRLLVVITARKASDQCKVPLKRGGGWNAITSDSSDLDILGQLVGREPTPEFAAMVSEGYEDLLDSLKDEKLRQIACWKMEGDTREQIAAKLGCGVRSVALKLELIRRRWRERQ
jgi:DNA-directed RNA polymerase specialized sigma24 family protein